MMLLVVHVLLGIWILIMGKIVWRVATRIRENKRARQRAIEIFERKKHLAAQAPRDHANDRTAWEQIDRLD